MPTIFRKRKPKEEKAIFDSKNVSAGAFVQFAMPVLETIGREKEISEILGILNKYNFVILSGKKYVGKTAIACEVAKRFGNSFDHIIYVNCVEWNAQELLNSFCNLLSTLQRDVIDINFVHVAFFEVIKSKKIFFIFDNLVENNNVFFNIINNIVNLDSNAFISKIIVIESHTTGSIYRNHKSYFEVPGIEENDVILLGKNESISISHEEALALIHNYNGCPIYIQIVLEYCKQFCNSNIGIFLKKKMLSVGNIENLLQEQFNFLPKDVKDLLYFVMLLGNNASIDEIISYLSIAKNYLYNMISLLYASNFISEVSSTNIKLILPVEEFLQKNFIQIVCEEIAQKKPDFLLKYPLLMNLVSEDIKTYQRYIMKKITTILHSNYSITTDEICNILFECNKYAQSISVPFKNYLAGNILNLLTISNVPIRNLSFANSYICNANLEDVELQNVDFTNAQFENCSFKNIFGSVTAMAYNKKHNLLATAFFNGLIIIWDKQGNQITILMEFNNSVNDIIFLNDKLFACGKDGRVIEWNMDNYFNFEIIREYDASKESIRTIAFSPVHNCLFSGSEDGVVKCWKLDNQIKMNILCQKPYRIKSIVISPDEDRIAIGGDSEELTVYDISSAKTIFVCNVDNRWIRCLDFYDKNTVLCGGDLGKINIIDLSKQTFDTIENADKNKIWSIISLPQCNCFIVGGNAGTLKVFDMNSRTVVCIMQKHSSWIRCLAIADSYLYSGSEDQTICIWDLSNYKCQKIIRGYTKRVFSVDCYEDKLYAGLGDHSVIEVDIDNRTTKILFNCSDQVWTISSRGCMICAGCDKGDIYIYDLNSSRILYTHHFNSGWIGSVKFSPQGDLLMVGDEYGTAYIFNTKNKYLITQTNKYKAHEGRVASALFCDDLIVSVGEDGYIFGFNYKRKRINFRFKVSDKLLYTVDKINNNEYLAGGSDGKVYLIDILNKSVIALVALELPIWSIKVADNCTFFVGTDNGELHKYTIDGVLLNKWSEHNNQIWSICINATQNQIITGGEDSQILVHSISPQVCIKHQIICNLPYNNVLLHNCKGLSDIQINYLCTMGAIE